VYLIESCINHMTSINSRFFNRILLLLILIALGTYGFLHYDLYVYFIHKEKAIAFINSYHPYDELVFIFLQILQVVAAPIPGEVTGLIGGYLYGPLMGTIYSTIGLTIGSWLAFLLARIFGLPFVERIVKPEIIQKYDYVMEHRGVLISFILFLIPGFPKDCLCYIMGLSHMTITTFLIISTTGRLAGTILLSVCGSFAHHHRYGALIIAFSVSGIFIILAYLYREKLINILRRKK
jgi:uncharacterized membrane protein YdjX (TVP38/TMEM64 family)